jgi:probable phosphoglycerate mutase
MRLTLIRHAESEHSKLGLIADIRGCRGLTVSGVTQTQRLCARFAQTGELNNCTILLTSPVLRARQTAEMLHQLVPDLALVEDDRLCEVRPGAADGLSWQEYAQQYGQFDLVAEPDRLFAPAGESWIGFLGRTTALLDRLATTYRDQHVVAVTHAGFIVATLLTGFAIPRPGTDARFDPAHTGITEWLFTPQGRALERYNDTFHLGWI